MRIGVVDRARIIESSFTGILKARGFRKRGRNWFRTTSSGEYQVINLQKSPWGGESFYLNLGWDPAVASGEFRSENFCIFGLRAENTDVVPSIDFVRPDGSAASDLPGIILLDAEMSSRIPEDSFVQQLIDVVVVPVADFMDRTPALQDLVPLLTGKPHLASIPVREELKRRGFTLPAM